MGYIGLLLLTYLLSPPDPPNKNPEEIQGLRGSGGGFPSKVLGLGAFSRDCIIGHQGHAGKRTCFCRVSNWMLGSQFARQ